MSVPQSSRSATVTGLSGRVSALKFMQRASPSSSPSNTPTKASQSTPLASPSPAPSAPGSPAVGNEEEQWTLSPAAIAKLRGKRKVDKKEGVKIVQEAGFDAWLIGQEKEQEGGSRQTFGSLGKRKQTAEEEARLKEEPNFEEEEEEEEPKGFVKPGTLTNKRSKHDEGAKKARKGSRDQDKVVSVRKGRGGKAGISGGRR